MSGIEKSQDLADIFGFGYTRTHHYLVLFDHMAKILLRLNIPQCYFDGGDCCLPEVFLTDCQRCQCHKLPNKCPNWNMVGNGLCDYQLDIKQCNYDEGDCGE